MNNHRLLEELDQLTKRFEQVQAKLREDGLTIEGTFYYAKVGEAIKFERRKINLELERQTNELAATYFNDFFGQKMRVLRAAAHKMNPRDYAPTDISSVPPPHYIELSEAPELNGDPLHDVYEVKNAALRLAERVVKFR